MASGRAPVLRDPKNISGAPRPGCSKLYPSPAASDHKKPQEHRDGWTAVSQKTKDRLPEDCAGFAPQPRSPHSESRAVPALSSGRNKETRFPSLTPSGFVKSCEPSPREK